MIPSTHRFITTHAASQSLSHLRIHFRQPSQASRSSGTLQFYSLYYATVISLSLYPSTQPIGSRYLGQRRPYACLSSSENVTPPPQTMRACNARDRLRTCEEVVQICKCPKPERAVQLADWCVTYYTILCGLRQVHERSPGFALGNEIPSVRIHEKRLKKRTYINKINGHRQTTLRKTTDDPR